MATRRHTLFALSLLAGLAAGAPAADAPPDYTRVAPESLGIKPVRPRK